MLTIYKTAKGILTASIRDIKAGLWCQGFLATIDENTLEQHPDTLGKYDGGNATLKKKPIGCALGLCALHGGDGEEIKVTNSITCVLVQVNEPTPDSPEPVQRAVRALYEAIPNRRDRYENEEDEDWFANMTGAIASYNDSHRRMDAARAVEWFEDALKTLKKP